MAAPYSIPGVYRRTRRRAEGFPRVRTDVAGFVGAAGPRHLGRAVAVEDWKGYVAAYRTDDTGASIDAPAGGALEKAVRDYFANGGQRLWIVNVAERIDPDQRQDFLNDMLGIGRSLDPHGLELLLRQHEVALVALPDLDAEETVDDPRSAPELPPPPACFGTCGRAGPGFGVAARGPTARVVRRLFSNQEMLWAQQYILERLERVRWRWFALLAPPPDLTVEQAVDWRRDLTARMGGSDLGALYWPWILVQDSPAAPVERRSPVGAVAGYFAATDLDRGPHVAPAGDALTGLVGLERPVADEDLGRAYDAGLNLLRPRSGRGIFVWGARTLLFRDPASAAEPLAFVNARRCLSAIARTAEVIGQPLVFEPNTPLTRIRLHQLMVGYLLTVFRDGGLQGAQPEEAFFVAVDEVIDNDEGQMVCRVGVALAAPAEFIEFRIGREGAVIETEEAA